MSGSVLNLKPCHCGYQGALSGTDHGVYFSLHCPQCKREVTAFTMSGLAEHWNKPAPDPQERNQ